jgi:DNA-binding response OmpR family regulator
MKHKLSQVTPAVALPLHILVVEDNDALRAATVDFLSARGHHATGVVSAEDVDDTPTADLPDLYIIDVTLPQEDGFQLVARIRHSQPHAGIVMMTARGQLADRLAGYSSGADIYLTKPVEQAELLLCINNMARRLKTGPPHAEVTLVLDNRKLTLSGPRGETSLTHGESLLLAFFCRAAGRKLERWQVLQLVDSKGKGLVPANLEMRISSLRKKLGVCGAPANAIRTIRGFGYALACDVKLI